MPLHGQMREEGLDFPGSHRGRVTDAVEEDEPANPSDIRLFSAQAHVTGSADSPYQLE